jgi:hypothetical protein
LWPCPRITSRRSTRFAIPWTIQFFSHPRCKKAWYHTVILWSSSYEKSTSTDQIKRLWPLHDDFPFEKNIDRLSRQQFLSRYHTSVFYSGFLSLRPSSHEYYDIATMTLQHGSDFEAHS